MREADRPSASDLSCMLHAGFDSRQQAQEQEQEMKQESVGDKRI